MASPTDREIGEQLAALNQVRFELGMDTEDDGSPAALVSGLAGVRAELEERVKERYQRFAGESLADQLGPDTSYLIEKVAELVQSTHPEADHVGDGSHFNEAMLSALTAKLRAIDDGLRDRGCDKWVRDDPSNAVYVCQRLRALVDGDEDAPAHADARLLANFALPALVKNTRALAIEIDEEMRNQPTGWPS